VSVFNKNTSRVLSYDVLRQQKTGVITKGVVSGRALTSFRLRHITSSPSQTLRRRLVQTMDDGRRGDRVLDTAAVRRGCFSHFPTRTVDNTVDLYAAKPDIRPELLCLPHLYSTPPLEGSRPNIAIPFGVEKLEWLGYATVKKIRKYLYSRT